MTRQAPLVSIVINNYNYGRFLDDAIGSALNQTYRHIEVIVVDDGSTDESRQILACYAGRIKSIFQENRGQSQAANTGFQASKGELVLFLDADDFLMPHAIETVIGLWEPDLSKVHFTLKAVAADGKPLPILVPRPALQEGDLSKLLLEHGEYRTPPTSGNAFSRRALTHVMPISQDWPSKKALDKYLLHSTPFFGPVRACQQALGFYRIHGKNLSQVTSSEERNIETMKAFLLEQLAVRDLIARIATQQGFSIGKKSITEGYSFRKTRLALRRMGETVEPLPKEPLIASAYRCVLASWRCLGLDFLSRCALTVWAVALVVIPGAAGRHLLWLGMSPMSRPDWLKRMVVFLSGRTEGSAFRLNAKVIG